MKTNIDNISKPKTILIVIGVLSGYIRNWPVFVFRLLFTFKSLKEEFIQNYLKISLIQLHLWHTCIVFAKKDE